MTVFHVNSIDLPALQPYRTLRRQEDHRARGIFVAEGEKVVRRLLASDLPVVSLLLSPAWAERLPAAELQRSAEVYVADDPVLRAITGFRMHQGVMGIAKIPREKSAEELLPMLQGPRLLAALDGITHAENVGVTVRNCVAFGVQGLLVGETCCSPWLRRAVRNSMGAVFRLPVIHSSDLCELLRILRDTYGMAIVVTDPHAGEPIDTVDFRREVCLVFGEEQSGVSKKVASLATVTARIPMYGGVDSLNVSSASAVALYEVQRQRRDL